MQLPNIITMIRIMLLPVYIHFFYSDMPNNMLYVGIIFLVAGISDILDGYIARKYNMESKLGAVLDPLADKLVVFTILISFTHKEIIPGWILLVMGFKELVLIIGALILYLFKGRQVLPSNIYGKLATIFFYVSIAGVLIKLPIIISKVLLAIMVILNVLALIKYIEIFKGLKKPE